MSMWEGAATSVEKMAEFEQPVQAGYLSQRGLDFSDIPFLPYWARSHVQYAQNLLERSDEPVEYDDEDEDYRDNCFFFPEDCTFTPPNKKGAIFLNSHITSLSADFGNDRRDKMIPELPDIKMLDAEVLGELLQDNLSPPEITSILVFATNGAIFAYASLLPPRQLRNLSATFGAAYTSYAKRDARGNLTGVNPASDPSSFVTATSIPLGDVGSIVFEHDSQVAVVTKIADKVLLAAAGPSRLENEDNDKDLAHAKDTDAPVQTNSDAASSTEPSLDEPNIDSNSVESISFQSQHRPPTTETGSASSHQDNNSRNTDRILEVQYEIDRNHDLARLASLNLSSSPDILLALESKSAVLGRFLNQKLSDLECPDDF